MLTSSFDVVKAEVGKSGGDVSLMAKLKSGAAFAHVTSFNICSLFRTQWKEDNAGQRLKVGKKLVLIDQYSAHRVAPQTRRALNFWSALDGGILSPYDYHFSENSKHFPTRSLELQAD